MMESFYLGDPKVWDFWPYIVFEPFYRDSLLDNGPFVKFIEQIVNENDFKRQVSWEAVDMQTG